MRSVTILVDYVNTISFGNLQYPTMDIGSPFALFAELCTALEGTTKRKEKRHLISEFLKMLSSEEVQPAVSFLIGKAFPEADERVLEVGGRTLWKLETTKQTMLIRENLTIIGVAKAFDAIASATGPGSRTKKENLIQGLLSQATPREAEYLARLLMAEMRIGAVEGVVIEAIAEASGAESALVQRANMLLGSLGEVATIALAKGIKALAEVGLRLFNPVKPMLAEMSYDISEVLKEHGGKTAFEWKFDGARIQIHKRDRDVRIFSRRLTDVTGSLPEIVSLTQTEVKAKEALVEGEVIAIGTDGKPLPFQDLMRRFRRVHEVEEMEKKIPLRLYLFDILYRDGKLLIDQPYSERWNILLQTVDSSLLAPRIITDRYEEAKELLDSTLTAGHEGLMAKALNSDYTPGVRGKKWFKIKPFESLDLVIIAADWGYGRRTGWLSNYHLAAYNEQTREFRSLGKTFKGLTDTEFEDMTRRLQALRVSESQYTVYVKPDIVVEVAYNEIQRSPHYKSGFALRFARITRIRDDKSPAEADTLSRVAELYEKQFEAKARLQSDLI